MEFEGMKLSERQKLRIAEDMLRSMAGHPSTDRGSSEWFLLSGAAALLGELRSEINRRMKERV